MTNTSPRRLKAAWPLGLLLASLMLATVCLFCDMRFATNDDTLVLRQMMGFGVLEIPDFNLYIHFLLLYPLRWLSLAFPGLPWFSWMQLFLIWLASAVMAKSILQCFHNAKKPLYLGLIAAVLFLGVFVMRYMSQVSYTVTAALLGAAAVLQLLSIDTENASCSSWICSAMLSLVMALLGYAMRQMTALPSLAFCGVAFVAQGLRRARAGQDWIKPLLCTLLAVCLVFGAVCGLREVEINTKEGVREYVDWQKQRIRIWDYYDLNQLPASFREEYNITDARLAMLIEWYLMDADMNTETLRAMGDALEAQEDTSLAARISKAVATLKAFPSNEPLAAKCLPALAGLVLLCLMGLLFDKERSRLGQLLAVVMGLCLLAALLFYLGMKGRLPMRGLLTAALPFAALMTGLMPACLPQRFRFPSAALCSLLAVATVVLCAMYLMPMWQTILQRPATQEEQAATDTFGALDDYAICNEEYLLIMDNTLSGDTRMFPTTEYGISKNITYWGGWEMRSPSYNALLEHYGFDPNNWTPENFLTDEVRLVRGVLDPPPQLLLDMLGEICEVDYYLDSEWSGVYSMYFEEW